ncbi:MAG TPA: Gfo/Idh/MocA family oxidoreductase [Candidatus Acidoferrum sp.]|nr:Gfo/Idh/MocA family oxidoreductase [Candidatus Acidoferrum sp.]
MNIGVIGCGYWGPNLVRNFAAMDDVRVVGISDLRPARLDFIRRQYPAVKLLTGKAEEVISSPEVDAVVICTPVSTHYELGMAALKAGKHVLMEKPFTATVKEAQELIELAAKKNLRLMVDHTFIYTGAVQTIKKYIDSGDLGDLYYFDSVRVNLGLFQHDINVIWDLAPHDVSIMDYLLGRPPRAVSATGVAHFESGIENIAYVTTFYDNKLMGHIHVNWLAPVKVRKTLVSGSKKMIIYDDVEPSEKVKVYDCGVDFLKDRDQIYNILIQYRTGDMLAPKIDLTEALKRITMEFYRSIHENRAPLTDGVAGLRVVKILEAANQSMRQNGQVVELAS